MKKKMLITFFAVLFVVAMVFVAAPGTKAATSVAPDYTVNANGEVIDADGELVTEISASGKILDMKGNDATIKVTATSLIVVDTHFMEGKWDLTGERAGKLTLAEGSTGTIEAWGQFGDYKYLKVENTDENGAKSYSFHPFNLTITQVGVNTYEEANAICVKAVFVANEVVRDMIDDYGLINITTNKIGPGAKNYPFPEGKYGVEAFFDLKDSLAEDVLKENESREVGVYMEINGMTIYSKTTVDVTPRTILKDLNDKSTDFAPVLRGKMQALMNREGFEHLQEYLPRFIDVKLNLREFENGTVTADKDSYVVGDTVTVTVTPDEGYSQKLYINNEPLLLDWKINTYSFVATEEVYNITGSFENNLKLGTSDKWDAANQAHGILNTYYTSGDSGWLGIEGGYESISVKVKNYQLGEDGQGVNEFNVMLGFKINDKTYTFRVIRQKNKYYCQRAGFAKPEGGEDWTKKELDAVAVAAILGDGVDFKLERIADNKLAVYVNGEKYDEYTMAGVTANHSVQKLYIGHYGNKGEHVEIPFVLADPIFRVTGGSWNLNDQYNGSITILNKTADGSTVITNANTYKEVSVTVKDYTPSKNEDGSLKQGGFSMQVAFIFDDGKVYEVRIHNTDQDGNYKIQTVGSTNSLVGWKWRADLTAAQKEDLLNGDGVKFTVKLEGSAAVMYVNDKKMATVDLGANYAGKTAQIKLCMNGNKNGQNIKVPFELN